MNTDVRCDSTALTIRARRRDPRGFVFRLGLMLVGATIAALATMQIAAQYHLQIL